MLAWYRGSPAKLESNVDSGPGLTVLERTYPLKFEDARENVAGPSKEEPIRNKNIPQPGKGGLVASTGKGKSCEDEDNSILFSEGEGILDLKEKSEKTDPKPALAEELLRFAHRKIR
ncbi:hypothetical protein U1Q18_007208 [Sarracenia purpurea var. burkii]